MPNTVNSWYIPNLTLILPGVFQRSAQLNEIFAAFATGFTRMDLATLVPSGSASTLLATSNRVVAFTGASMVYTLTLPAAPAATDPPIYILNGGIGNFITISGGAAPIMSSTASTQLALYSPGDYVILKYVDVTIGWSILGIRSIRTVTPGSSGTTVAMTRMMELHVHLANGYLVTITLPSGAQVGESLRAAITTASGLHGGVTFNGNVIASTTPLWLHALKNLAGAWKCSAVAVDEYF